MKFIKSFSLLMVIIMSALTIHAQEFSDPSRTEFKNDAGMMGSGSKSGFFQATQPVNFPSGASNWWHLLDVRHSNPNNNYAMQFSGSFFDQNLYFRKTNNFSWMPWSRVLLENGGNVGIGTTSPQYNLDVHGSNSWDGSTQIGIVNNASIYGRAQLVITGRLDGGNDSWTNNPRAGVVFNRNNGGSQGSIGTMGYAIQMELNSQSLGFVNASGVPNMIVKQNGNVGIGTPNTLDYKLAVEGTIGARKVRVTQEGWADYVFAPTYKLLPLQDLETYIKQHNHLPEVPTTDEVTKNGIDLGDNQAVLLKKIEELTLYVIEQEKQRKIQAGQIANMQAEINALKKDNK